MECHTIYITIMNKSSQTLQNKLEDNSEIGDIHGKWITRAKTNINKSDMTSCTKEIKEAAWVGPEGNLTYDVGVGMGTISFVFACPLSDDDKGYGINSGPIIIYEVYGNNEEDFSWNEDGSNWGTEGDVPTKDCPLSLLFVIYDSSAGK